MSPLANSAIQGLPPHLEEGVRAIALLRNAHHEKASRAEKLVDVVSALVSRPAFLVVICAAVTAWVAVNEFLKISGLRPLDTAPFPWAGGVITFLALIVAVLIVITQHRADGLSELREQMTLELMLLCEQKTSKIISLMEEMRRDSPQLQNRLDAEAHKMSTRADPGTVLEAIEKAQL